MSSVRYYDWIAHFGRRTPDKIAAHDLASERRLSYAQFDARISRLATHLRYTFGVTRGERVAVLALNTTDTLEVQFACFRIGAVFLPLNTRLTVPELQFIVGDSSPKVMIHDTDLAEVALAVAKLCGVSSALRFGADGSYEAAIAASAPLDCAEIVTLDDISTIMYTSGTTGQPKGAIITHGMTFWNCVNLGGPAYISPSSVLLTVLPLFHTGGLNCYTNPVLHAGGTALIMRAFDPGLALQLISDPAHGINQFFGVPSIYQFMAQHPAFATSDFSRLVIGGVGGAPMPVPLLKVWEERGVALQQGYGMTETSPAVLTLDKEDAARKAGVRQAGAAYGSANRPPRRHRRRCWRTWRTLGQGTERHARLLEQAGGQRIVIHRWLAAHRRRHARRRRGLLLHRRSLEGHVHLRRRERLSGRGRERAASAHGHRRSGHHRRPERAMGRSRYGDRGRQARPYDDVRGNSRALRGQSGAVQMPEAGRVRRCASAKCDRENSQADAAAEIQRDKGDRQAGVVTAGLRDRQKKARWLIASGLDCSEADQRIPVHPW